MFLQFFIFFTIKKNLHFHGERRHRHCSRRSFIIFDFELIGLGDFYFNEGPLCDAPFSNKKLHVGIVILFLRNKFEV